MRWHCDDCDWSISTDWLLLSESDHWLQKSSLMVETIPVLCPPYDLSRPLTNETASTPTYWHATCLSRRADRYERDINYWRYSVWVYVLCWYYGRLPSEPCVNPLNTQYKLVWPVSSQISSKTQLAILQWFPKILRRRRNKKFCYALVPSENLGIEIYIKDKQSQ